MDEKAVNNFYCPASKVLSIHTTEDCNLFCKGCYTFLCKKNVRVLNVKTAIKAIEKFEPKIIQFYGGEALLHPDIIREIMQSFPDKIYRIHTNGTTYTHSVRDILNAMEYIQLTVDSLDYDWLHKNKRMTPLGYSRLLELIKDYSYKIEVTRNIGASGNDFSVVEELEKRGIPESRIENCILITDDETQEAIPKSSWVTPKVPRSQPKKAKLRLLTSGEITNDLRGVNNCFTIEECPTYKDFPALPESERCICCKYRSRCSAFDMFPDFVKDILERVDYEPHFCKIARLYAGDVN